MMIRLRSTMSFRWLVRVALWLFGGKGGFSREGVGGSLVLTVLYCAVYL